MSLISEWTSNSAVKISKRAGNSHTWVEKNGTGIMFQGDIQIDGGIIPEYLDV